MFQARDAIQQGVFEGNHYGQMPQFYVDDNGDMHSLASIEYSTEHAMNFLKAQKHRPKDTAKRLGGRSERIVSYIG